jgi:hypothetical protein
MATKKTSLTADRAANAELEVWTTKRTELIGLYNDFKMAALNLVECHQSIQRIRNEVTFAEVKLEAAEAKFQELLDRVNQAESHIEIPL